MKTGKSQSTEHNLTIIYCDGLQSLSDTSFLLLNISMVTSDNVIVKLGINTIAKKNKNNLKVNESIVILILKNN